MVWLIKVGEYPAICSGPPFHMQEQFGTGLTKAGCGGVALEQGGVGWYGLAGSSLRIPSHVSRPPSTSDSSLGQV